MKYQYSTDDFDQAKKWLYADWAFTTLAEFKGKLQEIFEDSKVSAEAKEIVDGLINLITQDDMIEEIFSND